MPFVLCDSYVCYMTYPRSTSLPCHRNFWYHVFSLSSEIYFLFCFKQFTPFINFLISVVVNTLLQFHGFGHKLKLLILSLGRKSLVLIVKCSLLFGISGMFIDLDLNN